MAEVGVQTDKTPFITVCVFLRKFKNDWVPNDPKTYNLLLCTLSVMLSSINFGLLMTYYTTGDHPRCMDYAYTLAGIFCASELYEGLNKKIPQKFFFWFLLKIFEGWLQVATFISVVNVRRGPYDYHTDKINVTALTIVVHIWFMYYITRRAQEAKRHADSQRQQVDLNEILLKNNLNNIKNIN